MMTSAGEDVRSGPEALALPALLNRDLGHLDGLALLRVLITRVFRGRTALLSSFGAEAAVLLHMVAKIDRSTPVLFLDTGKLFAETHDYRQALCSRLGLSDVRAIAPALADIARHDPKGDLWRRDPDACCHLRKVEPLQGELDEFSAVITGRKRFHGGLRSGLDVIGSDGERVSVNPLARWPASQVRDYMAIYDLPAHPLRALGYLSIGCAPCTAPPGASADPRAGRWRGREKTECGIHFVGGRIVRGSPDAQPN